MKNQYKRPCVSYKKFTDDNDNIIIVAIKESWHVTDPLRCKIVVEHGTNGITDLECHFTRLNDLQYTPDQMIFYCRHNPYSLKDWESIMGYISNGILSRLDMINVLRIITRGKIELS